MSRLTKRRRLFSLRLLVFSFGYKYRLFKSVYNVSEFFKSACDTLFRSRSIHFKDNLGEKSKRTCSGRTLMNALRHASLARFFISYHFCSHTSQATTYLTHIHNSFHKVSQAASNVDRRTAYLSHTKDYGIKPLRYLFRFLLHSLSPYGYGDRQKRCVTF